MSPEVGVDPKTISDACAEDDYLLSSHVFDNPSKVRELPTLDAMAENTEKELNLWPSVGPLHEVVVLESNELANSIGLVARK